MACFNLFFKQKIIEVYISIVYNYVKGSKFKV